MPDLTWYQWIGVVLAVPSGLAAWFGLWISWRNSRILKRQHSVRLRASVVFDSWINATGERQIDSEEVRISVMNEGRTVHIESMILFRADWQQYQKPFLYRSDYGRYKCETQMPWTWTIKKRDLVECDQPEKFRRLRIFLIGDEMQTLRIKHWKKLLKDVRELQRTHSAVKSKPTSSANAQAAS